MSAPTCKRVEGKSGETLQFNADPDDKYYVYSSDIEADMDEVERITQLLAQEKGSAETVAQNIFWQGTELEQREFYQAAEAEISNMLSNEGLG